MKEHLKIQKKNGYGKLYNKEGDILYDGSFKNSKKEGYGKLYYYNNKNIKNVIESEFKKGLIWNYKNNKNI